MNMKRPFVLIGMLRTAAVMVLLATMIMPYSLPPTYAATIPTLSSIRVALFLEAGSLHQTSPYVTISSAKGLAIGNRKAMAVTPWLGGAALTQIRVGLDQYGVLLLDTADYLAAAKLADLLNTAGLNASVSMRTRQGQAVFKVLAGPYPSRDEAVAALDQLTKQPSWSAFVKAPALTGPLHLSAGTFASETEANTRMATLTQAGVEADLVYTEDAAGKPVVAVWVGAAADAQQQAAIQAKAQQQVPGLILQPVTSAIPYAIQRDDVTGGTGNGQKVTALQIAANGLKLAVQPADPAAKMLVAEKTSPGYPGLLELSGYNGQLAVVNELPFEQYVGSVVASEMGTGWPLEALKAQAVAARTYALDLGMKYTIANISDSTVDQAYAGKEAVDTTQAAASTKGEVLVDAKGLISPIYSANAGGMTADPSEIWGGTAAYVKPVASPDEGPAKGKAVWRRVALPDGTIGFAHSLYLRDTGTKNAAGLPIYSVSDNGLNIRTGPTTSATAIAKLNAGDRVVAIGAEPESNEFAWYRGPLDASKLAAQLKLSGPVTRLEVTRRGPSGRVLELTANGQPVVVKYPYLYRSMLGDVLSTKFDIEETGRYTIQGVEGAVRSLPDTPGTLYAVQGASGSAEAVVASKQIAVMSGNGQVRVVTKDPQYVFHGNGYGHGLGMSQWGARGFAEQGYDYRKILTTYYTGVSIIRTE